MLKKNASRYRKLGKTNLRKMEKKYCLTCFSYFYISFNLFMARSGADEETWAACICETFRRKNIFMVDSHKREEEYDSRIFWEEHLFRRAKTAPVTSGHVWTKTDDRRGKNIVKHNIWEIRLQLKYKMHRDQNCQHPPIQPSLIPGRITLRVERC